MLKPEGYAVDTAPSGTEALALLLSLNRPADLLIADLNLPDMSGTLLAEAAFTQGLARRVLFVSGYGEDPHAMAPVLGKPFSCDELCRRVAALVRGVAAFLACVSV
jgi:DNA-binding response OmpR family regulator